MLLTPPWFLPPQNRGSRETLLTETPTEERRAHGGAGDRKKERQSYTFCVLLFQDMHNQISRYTEISGCYLAKAVAVK